MPPQSATQRRGAAPSSRDATGAASIGDTEERRSTGERKRGPLRAEKGPARAAQGRSTPQSGVRESSTLSEERQQQSTGGEERQSAGGWKRLWYHVRVE